MHNYPVIRLKPGKERSLLQRHPWVFSGAIARQPNDLQEGDLVVVESSQGAFLAIGHFHKGTITVRCLSFSDGPIDEHFIRERISACIMLRRAIGLPNKNTDCFRLIHGEGDGFPGLVVDVYGNVAVVQTYTLGMHRLRHQVTEAITELAPYITAVYDKSRESMAKQGIDGIEDGYLKKSPNHVDQETVLENGLQIGVDYIQGQKTGFFLDQRDNRNLLRSYSKDKSVLNTFCYTGGFSIAALEGGANLVHSVDSSARAMEGTRQNVERTEHVQRHEGFTKEVMPFLKSCDRKYDVVVLDPPAYAKHLSQVSQAMIGYRNLNTEGLKSVSPGGLLFTFSCSQAVDRELFRKLIFQAGLQAGRNLRILHQLTQPADHPVSIYHPEAEYLKGLVLHVS
jgi:23S rRNA (cytosine1962-C5)-methyltransferase